MAPPSRGPLAEPLNGCVCVAMTFVSLLCRHGGHVVSMSATAGADYEGVDVNDTVTATTLCGPPNRCCRSRGHKPHSRSGSERSSYRTCVPSLLEMVHGNAPQLAHSNLPVLRCAALCRFIRADPTRHESHRVVSMQSHTKAIPGLVTRWLSPRKRSQCPAACTQHAHISTCDSLCQRAQPQTFLSIISTGNQYRGAHLNSSWRQLVRRRDHACAALARFLSWVWGFIATHTYLHECGPCTFTMVVTVMSSCKETVQLHLCHTVMIHSSTMWLVHKVGDQTTAGRQLLFVLGWCLPLQL